MSIIDQSLKPGVLLCNGQYQIIRVIGQGGFGITYLAFDKKLETEVCIKEFFPSTLYNRLDDSMSVGVASKSNENVQLADTIKTKFLKEARRLAQLDNPSIVRVRNAFEENNTAYYVMDLIPGKSLNEIVKENGPLTLSRALKYIEQVGDALTYIHARRINHLDVKPANILIDTANDRAVLIDFGLSKQYDDRGNQTSMTPTGVSTGYAPVEQYDANGLAEFSAPTDVYSLGATLYFLLTGIRPPLALKINEEILLFPDTIPDNIQNAVQRAMSMFRQDRFATVSEFVNALRSPAPKPQKVWTVSTTVDAVASPKKSKTWLWILTAVVLIGAGVATWYFVFNKTDKVAGVAGVAQVDPYALKGFHLHPDNLDILVEVISPDGITEGYLSEADYNALTDAQRAAVTPIGIYIARSNVEPFIYDLDSQTEDKPNLTWADAVSRYGSAMMTRQQAESLLSDRGDLKKILASLGIAVNGSYHCFATNSVRILTKLGV